MTPGKNPDMDQAYEEEGQWTGPARERYQTLLPGSPGRRNRKKKITPVYSDDDEGEKYRAKKVVFD